MAHRYRSLPCKQWSLLGEKPTFQSAALTNQVRGANIIN
jgi:hypothetical protein